MAEQRRVYGSETGGDSRGSRGDGEREAGKAHDLTLEGRGMLTMTGVTEVVRFEETAVVLRTALGNLLVQGQDLKLRTLSLEGGRMELRGKITGMIYEEPRESGGWLSRVLGR